MKTFVLCILILIFSMILTLVVELQFLDWPFSPENNKFLVLAGVSTGLISLLPFLGFRKRSLGKRVLTAGSISVLCALLLYTFNLVLFTI